MILGYEVPQGSKIHFTQSARIKRKIEQIAVEIFYQNNYEEIATPSFSFAVDTRILGKRKIIRISADENNQMILRNDNTIDVIKIINRHLGNKIDNKKWFYIQPAFSYPSTEINQIGAECLDEQSFENVLCVAVEIMKQINLDAILQISNMQIPLLCARELNLNIEIFSKMQVDKIMQIGGFLSELLAIQNKFDLDSYIKKAPNFLKKELEIMLECACAYENTIFSPLYYSRFGYYENLFFRAFSNNKIFLLGGRYEIDGIHSCGFAIYTNEVVEALLNSDSF